MKDDRTLKRKLTPARFHKQLLLHETGKPSTLQMDVLGEATKLVEECIVHRGDASRCAYALYVCYITLLNQKK